MARRIRGRRGRTMEFCSFCNREQDEVDRLIAGPNSVYICDECVDLCKEILEEEEKFLAEEVKVSVIADSIRKTLKLAKHWLNMKLDSIRC